MATFCLVKQLAEKFKNGLKDGSISFKKLIELDGKPREDYLAEKFGKDNAIEMNKEFEKKLILKDVNKGLENFINKMSQEGRYSPERIAEAKKALEEHKLEQEQRVLSPGEEQAFLKTLSDKMLGFEATREQAKVIFDSMDSIRKIKENLDTTGEDPAEWKWKDSASEIEYGKRKVALQRYTEALEKGGERSIKQMLKDRGIKFKTEWQESGGGMAVGSMVSDIARGIANTSISLVANVDNSFIGRQGLRLLTTGNYKQWANIASNSFADFGKVLGGQKATDALLSKIYSDPLYISGEYEKAGFFSGKEEQFPTSLPSRIPYLGRVFEASEAAFTNSALRARTEMYKLYRQAKVANGIKMDNAEIKSTGKIVGALTAKSDIGRGDNALIKTLLWAPKMLKANIDVLTAHTFDKNVTKGDKALARGNLLKIIGTTVVLMGVAKAINQKNKDIDAEFDPRSSDFGKIKYGDTRFDITAGASSIVTLSTRLIMGSSKSSTTGVVSEYGSKYGQRSRLDALVDFMVNKAPPSTGAVWSYMKGETFSGEKPTLMSSLMQMSTPISVRNYIEVKEDPSLDRFIGATLDLFGVNGNTYRASEVNWQESDTKELTQFKEKVGKAEFDKANKNYNKIANDKMDLLMKTKEYKSMSNDDKKSEVSKIKEESKKEIFNLYNFKYKK